MAALCWTFIGSMVLCYAYAAYFILCAIAYTLTASFILLLFIVDHALAPVYNWCSEL